MQTVTNSNFERPDPDKLLKSIQEESDRHERGKLKLFLGMCAGVGKTYTMLKHAQVLKQEGKEIVIGYVETHLRKETDLLLEGLEIIPRKQIIYRDITLEEMDVDAIIRRQPTIVIVDELAHTNMPGSRNLKRYLDVEEILNKGIDVYTAINIQHIESRSETVEEITGIKITETIPDSFLQYAEFELVDITPEDLLKRMKEGKIYIPDRAAVASKNFFRKGNLHALRELALRFTAERVDFEMLDYMKAKNISLTWKTTEKLMVAVGPSPNSQRLIRWTRRMAYNMGAQWIAVCVDLGNTLKKKEQELLLHNIELAQSLGAEIIRITHTDVVDGLINVALQHNITQIIVGATHENRFSQLFKGGSIIERLIENREKIDIYVVKSSEERQRKRFVSKSTIHSKPQEYFWGILVLSLISTFCIPLRSVAGYQTIGIIYTLTIASLSLFIGRTPIILSAALGSLAWNYLFVPPLYDFHISRIQDVYYMIVNFLIAISAGTLISKTRKNKHTLEKGQTSLSTLLSLLESLNNTASIKEVISATQEGLKRYFDADAVVYLKEKNGINLAKRAFGKFSLYNAKEFSVANWCFENQRVAGKGTNTLSESAIQYYPLLSRQGIIGVIGLETAGLDTDQKVLMKSFISLVTSSLQREINIDKTKVRQISNASHAQYEHVVSTLTYALQKPIDTLENLVALEMDPNITLELTQTLDQMKQLINDIEQNTN